MSNLQTPLCCLLCQSQTSVHFRTFRWELRPRHKDLLRGHTHQHTTLDVNLCDLCYEKNANKVLVGWDEWDAIDGLEKR